MVCKLAIQCNVVYGFIKCALPEDMINVDLMIHTLNGIHTFKKDYKSQNSKCSLWRAKVQPCAILRKKMVEFMCRRQITTTPFANKTYNPNNYHPKNLKEEKPSSTYKTR